MRFKCGCIVDDAHWLWPCTPEHKRLMDAIVADMLARSEVLDS